MSSATSGRGLMSGSTPSGRWGQLGAGGATYGRRVMEQARPTDTIERRLHNLDPLLTWAQALSHNLRRLKVTGHDASALNKLADHAQGLVASIHERHGW